MSTYVAPVTAAPTALPPVKVPALVPVTSITPVPAAGGYTTSAFGSVSYGEEQGHLRTLHGSQVQHVVRGVCLIWHALKCGYLH